MDLLFFVSVILVWGAAFSDVLPIDILGDIEETSSDSSSVKKDLPPQGCSDRILKGSGVIESPGYPQSYLIHISCSWLIQGRPGEIVTIRFDDLDIEESGDCGKPPCCAYNWIKIGPSVNHTDVKYCGKGGQRPPVFISSGNQASIKYHVSRLSVGGRGFKLLYWTRSRKPSGCGANEFMCPDGSCIPRIIQCRSKNNCEDKTDEVDCPDQAVEMPSECASNQFRCTDGTCISQIARCDGQTDCGDKSDEVDCPGSCTSGRSCSTVVYCYDASKYCDGILDCPDYSDETNCGYCSVNYTRCGPESTQCYNPATQRCNKVLDCTNGEDEKDCKRFCPNKIMCASGTGCYSLSDRCNGIAQCGDSSDEKGCGPELCNFERGGFLCDNGLCIREVWKCDHTYDCGDGSDEVNCLRNSVLTAAIMGSLICVLLLIIAISCTCRLYALRSMDNHLNNHETPLSRLSQEFFFREPPPSYAVAVGEHPRSLCVENLHYGVGPRRSRRRPRRPRRRHEMPHSSPVSALDSLLNQNCIIIGSNHTVPLPSSIPAPVHSSENLCTQPLNQGSQNTSVVPVPVSDSNISEPDLIQGMPSLAQSEITQLTSSYIDVPQSTGNIIITELIKDSSVPFNRSSSESSSTDSDIQCTLHNADGGGANILSMSSGSTSEFNCDTDDMQPLIP